MMRFIGLDTETEPITDEVPNPPIVCMSLSDGKAKPRLVGRSKVVKTFCELYDAGYTFAIHNAAFDMVCLMELEPGLTVPIFELYLAGRVRCTFIRENLIAIRNGDHKIRRNQKQFNLGFCAQKYLKMHLDKSAEGWRTRYNELIGIPVKDWPKEAKNYAMLDAVAHYGVWKKQANKFKDQPEDFVSTKDDELRQTRAAFAYQLMSNHGFRSDPKRVPKLEKQIQTQWVKEQEHFLSTGIMRAAGPKKEPLRKISRNTKAIQSLVTEAYKKQRLPVPTTDKGNIQMSGEVLRESLHPELMRLAKALDDSSDWIKYGPSLMKATEHPWHSHWNPLVDSGRSSCSGIALQTLPTAPGVRECIIPVKRGNVFIVADWISAELCSHAQVLVDLIGKSDLAKVLKSGRNPHVEMFAKLKSVSYKTAAKMKKQNHKEWKGQNKLVKAANFGFPGGLGAAAFVGYAKAYNPEDPIILTDEEARNIREVWFQTYSEMRPYFSMVSEIVGDFGPGYMTHHITGRIRGRVGYCECANGFFQGLTADGKKEALFWLAYACYCLRSSSLYGARIVAEIHDEFLLEVAEEKAPEAAEELCAIMNESMRRFITVVPVASSPAIMRRWYKSAEEVRDNQGRLAIWEPRK